MSDALQLTDEERAARVLAEQQRIEAYLLERLRRDGRAMHLWQLGYGDHNVELALYRLRKRGLVVHHKKRGWSLR